MFAGIIYFCKVHRLPFPLLTVLLAGILLTLLLNSCKKDEQASLRDYLSGYGRWELASLQSTSSKRFAVSVTDTLITTCGTDRFNLAFDASNNVSFQNFQCLKGTATGSWTLNKDSLMMHINVRVTDTLHRTSKAENLVPFANARIETLGRNSLVLIIGDIKPYYPDDSTHVSYRYSFIHPSQ